MSSNNTRSFLPALVALTALSISIESVIAGDFDFDLDAANELSPPVGTIIDSSNVEQSSQLLDPEFAELIEQGWVSVTVGEPQSFDPHPAFIEATERNNGQTQLGGEPGELIGYEGGRPFPGELSLDATPPGASVAICGGRAATPISPPSFITTILRTTFCSSRTLPGQS